MKWTLCLLLFLPTYLSATLINYEFSYDARAQFYEDFSGTGNFVIDDELGSLRSVSVLISGAPLFTWQGDRSVDYVVFDPAHGNFAGTLNDNRLEDGNSALYPYFEGRDIDPEISIWLQLDKTLGWEMPWGFSTPNSGHQLFLEIGKPQVVPEPATLSLLALGLAAIGIRRRYS